MNIFFSHGRGDFFFIKKMESWINGYFFFSSRGGTVFFKKMDMNGFFFFSREGGLFFFFLMQNYHVNVRHGNIYHIFFFKKNGNECVRLMDIRSLALSLPPFNGNE